MFTRTEIRLTLVLPDVEVVSVRADDGKVETFINGGADLDGCVFVSDAELDAQHRAACLLARSAA